MQFKSRNHTGFTLIELLVVLAVIAVLLAILLPSLRAARALAKRVGCQSNLKQIALAWNMYVEDHDGRFYQGRYANLNYGGWEAMRGGSPRPLNKYLKLPATLETERGAEVFCCPADRGGIPAEQMVKVFRYYGTSYITNIMLIGQNQVLVLDDKFRPLHEEINKRLPNLNLNSVDNPSRLLLIGDYGWLNEWRLPPHPDENLKELAEWHGRAESFNMAFLDSHVKFLHIRKGFYVTDEYTVLPFEDLYGLAREIQSQDP